MKESTIEKAVSLYAKERGVLSRKWSSPSYRSVPDRLFFGPYGALLIVEFKAKGKQPTESQKLEHGRLMKLGHQVHVVDDINQGKALIDAIAIPTA